MSRGRCGLAPVAQFNHAIHPIAEDSRMLTVLTYTDATIDDRFQTRLVIQPDGEARLSVGSNRPRPKAPIGLYCGPLSAEELRDLSQLLGAPAFLQSSSQQELMPNETYRALQLSGAGRELTKLIGESLPAPAAFVAVEQRLAPIMNQLRRRPQLELALDAAIESTRIRPGDSMRLDLAIRNLSPATIAVDSPARWSQNNVQAELRALRDDIPMADLRSEHQYVVSLDADHLVTRAHPGQVQLGPGQPLNASFALPVDWAPGRYRLTVELALTVQDPSGKDIFSGGLVGKPLSVELVAR